MSIISVLARKGLAMAVAVVLSGSFHPLAFDTARAAVIQKTGSMQLYGGDGPIIRIGLITDATSVSLSSPSGLNVRRLTTGDRDDGQIASSVVRVEVRRQPAVTARRPKSRNGEKDPPARYKPRSRYTEAAGRPGDSTAGQGRMQVVALEASRLLASSEDVMIV
ncbi:MAG TPA: hypothetical protein VNO14_14455, partial [Blastocatellia bacterium]|nr:hypothetical protein [Blastocatellia bacterium]